MRQVIFLILFSLVSVLNAEIRAVWALPWDINSPEAIDNLVQTAVASNQNELLVEVRYRSDALYNTALGIKDYPNPEPRSHTLNGSDFDPLTYVLQKGHANGLKVHAWVIVFNATPTEPNLIARNYIYQNHREWITYGESGMKMSSGSQFGNFIDPGIPEVQEYLINVFSNLVSGYPELDGIHLDYIRYPEAKWGYHPVSIARYGEYCRNKEEITFNEWRIMQVSGFVSRLNRQMKELNPRIITSAAVFADIAEANVAYAQDWPSWLRKGDIDRIYPMAYSLDLKIFTKQLEQFKLLKRDASIVPGLRAWDANGKALTSSSTMGYNISDIAKRIELVRKNGFGGIALFSHTGLKVGDAWKLLTKLSYPAMEMPVLAQNEMINEPDQVYFFAQSNGREYVIDITVPSEGRWRWELHDREMVYHRYRYYLQGRNLDYWNGIPEDMNSDSHVNAAIKPGKYTVHLYREDADYKYLIPLELGALDIP